MASYEMHVVGVPGIDLADEPPAPTLLADVVPTRIRKELNGSGETEWVMAVLDPAASELAPDVIEQREVQVWRDGVLYEWLRPEPTEADDKTVSFRGAGLTDYFSDRYFGPNSHELLVNGDFESVNPSFPDEIPSWTKNLVVGGPATALAPDFIPTARGDWVASLSTELVSGETVEDAEGKDAYISQTLRITTGDLTGRTFETGFRPGGGFHYTIDARPHFNTPSDPVPKGLLLTLSGWYQTHYTESGGDLLWAGPAAGSRGLYIARKNATTGVVIADDWAPITDDTEAVKWVRLEVSIVVPPSTTEDIEVRLYAPGNLTWWDACSLTYPESVGSVEGGSPVADIMRDIVIEAAQLHVTKTLTGVQSTLGIGFQPPVGTPGGRKLERDYQYADHGNIGSALTELAEAAEADFAINWTPDGLSRWVECYPDGKGTHKPNLGIRIHTDEEPPAQSVIDAHPTRATAWRYTYERSAKSVRVLGQGDGTDREIGYVFEDPDPGTHQVSEVVISAGADTPVKALDDLARREWNRRNTPVRISELTVVSEVHCATLEVGDTIDVFVDFGYIQDANTYRVVWTEVLPQEGQGDVMVIGLNKP